MFDFFGSNNAFSKISIRSNSFRILANHHNIVQFSSWSFEDYAVHPLYRNLKIAKSKHQNRYLGKNLSVHDNIRTKLGLGVSESETFTLFTWGLISTNMNECHLWNNVYINLCKLLFECVRICFPVHCLAQIHEQNNFCNIK